METKKADPQNQAEPLIYPATDFEVAELGAQAALDAVVSMIQQDPELRGQALIDKIEAYRREANEMPDSLDNLRSLLPDLNQLLKKSQYGD